VERLEEAAVENPSVAGRLAAQLHKKENRNTNTWFAPRPEKTATSGGAGSASSNQREAEGETTRRRYERRADQVGRPRPPKRNGASKTKTTHTTPIPENPYCLSGSGLSPAIPLLFFHVSFMRSTTWDAGDKPA